jgi:hypothetical protein
MMTQDIKAIVGFFDILGYDFIVKKMIQDIEFVKRVENQEFETDAPPWHGSTAALGIIMKGDI